MKTLVWKELREVGYWIPLGMVLASVICWMCLPARPGWVMISGELVGGLSLLGAAGAFLLGILQSVRDLRPSVDAYLCHRSVTRSQIFWAKLLAGGLVYAVSLGLPLLVLACWLNAYGIEKYPVRPAQVLPALVAALGCFAFHPAAILVMTRSAAWFGSRLLPLSVATVGISILGRILAYGGIETVVRSFPFALLLVAVYVWCAHQSWCHLSREPSKPHAFRSGWAVPILLMACCELFVVALASLSLISVELTTNATSFAERHRQTSLDITTGDPWILEHPMEYRSDWQFKMNVNGANARRLTADWDIARAIPGEPVPNDVTLMSLVSIRTEPPGNGLMSRNEFFYNWYTSGWIYDDRGYWLSYSRDGLQEIIDQEGVHPPGDFPSRPFHFETGPMPIGYVSYEQSGGEHWRAVASLIATSNGVLQLVGSKFQTLIDSPIRCVGDIQQGENGVSYLMVGTEERLQLYSLVVAANDQPWTATDEQLHFESREVPVLRAKLERSIPLRALQENPSRQLARAGFSSEGCTLEVHDPATRHRLMVKLSNDGTIQERFVVRDSRRDLPGQMMWIIAAHFGVTPPSAALGVEALGYLTAGRLFLFQFPSLTLGWAITTALALVLSCAWIRWLSERRGMAFQQQLGWYLLALPLGLAAPLALLVIVPRPFCEPCRHCQKMSCVDLARCEHCDAERADATNIGIELFDTPPRQRDAIAIAAG